MSLLHFAVLLPCPVSAQTAFDLTNRIEVDGFTPEYDLLESVFGLNDEEDDRPEESARDSQWGPFNDLNQIRVTWDAQFLYIAVEGYIDGNNMILFIDTTNRAPETPTDDGLFAMTDVNSWRRNFVFSPEFTPDLFFATWDQNTLPQLWTYSGTNSVVQVNSQQFQSVATFDQSSTGRAMEAAIPWNVVFDGNSEQIEHPALPGPAWSVPAGMDTLRMAAVITAGDDGTGGPDSAPDNFGGHTIDSAEQVTIDNFAILPLDIDDIPGIPDFGIFPKERIGFKRRPPIRGITFELSELTLESPVVSPETGIPLRFELRIAPEPDPLETFRTVSLTARIYNSLGRQVRVLYFFDERPAVDPNNQAKDIWDGLVEDGSPAPGGIYVLSVVSEPGLSRNTAAFGVVR